MVSLRLNAHALTHLVPQWFTLRNARGDIEDEADPAVIRFAAERRLPIIAMVHNFRKGWQVEDLHRLLNDELARHNLVDAIRNNLLEHRFAGVNIDFEGLAVNDREPMVLLMRELAATLHPLGLLVTQSVPVDDPAYDLVKLAAVNDYLMLMVYEEHYQTGPPGPVASARWFDAQVARVAQSVPLDHIGIRLDRQTVEGDKATDDQQEGQRHNDETLMERKMDKPLEHAPLSPLRCPACRASRPRRCS
jgi:spore germination protein YaaH